MASANAGGTVSSGRNPIRRAPVAVVSLRGVSVDDVIAGSKLPWLPRVARGPGVIRDARCLVAPFVCEEAAFDERYNIRLHPTHGARARAPRVPALRVVS